MQYFKIYPLHTLHRWTSQLIPQRLDVIHFLHSFCSQYKRMLFLYANAIFNADAHAAEVGWVSFCVGNVEAASTKFISGVQGWRSGYGSLRLNSDTLPRQQFCLSRLTWSIVDV